MLQNYIRVLLRRNSDELRKTRYGNYSNARNFDGGSLVYGA